MTNGGALDGVTVLDASQILAGPFCTMLLADMGANVIKVEKPTGGDDTRRMGPPFIEGESAAFLQMNRNKRSIVLDIRSDDGKEAFKRLVAKSDILIENSRPGSMARNGLGWDDLKVINPALVYCSISGFGLTGPYGKRAGFDLVAQGMSGLMSANGHPDSPPAKIAVPVADLNAGMFSVYGILAAYVNRLKTGEGQHLETSLLESAMAYTVWESAIYFSEGTSVEPAGSRHRLAAPYQALRTADGYFNIGAANQNNWERFAHAIGRDELLEDERFSSNAARMGSLDQLEAELEKTTTQQPTAHWIDVLAAAGVPAGPIYNMEEAWSDPQVIARGMDVVLEHPISGETHNIGNPVKMSGTPAQMKSAAPILGQHTDEILEFAGYSADEIKALREQGVAGPQV
ncbi:MAG: CoA transferase [Chloroflexi bacterium]|nr:CoA transferase [Chloroflexota bacterium]